MKILTVVGARPNFMKAAPIVRAIERHNQEILRGQDAISGSREALQHVLVHTGQHYDELMSDSFFADLNLPRPDAYLGVGSGSHAAQTAEIVKKFEEVLLKEHPDVVLVVGDVNSTLACAMVAAKISFDSDGTRPLLAHVEAGLRSFDRTMPEEHNRVLTDHLSDILFVTEQSGVENLKREGISLDRVHFVGNTMIDSLLAFKDKAETSRILECLRLRSDRPSNGHRPGVRPYALLTLHRPGNVDNPGKFLEILQGLEEVAAKHPIIFPCHPRSQKRIAEFGLGRYFQTPATTENAPELENRIYLINPLGYLDFLCLMKHATIVLTDSGGIQEETTCLGIPCVTIRENTERPVTVEWGTNIIAGTRKEGIREAIRRQIERTCGDVPKNWDGQAAPRIVEVLLRARHTGASSGMSLPVPSDAHQSTPEVSDRREMLTLPPYVLITPARNEAEFIELTIKSVVSQTVRPAKWVIVSDGSTDATDDIVKRYAVAHPWIALVRMPERRERHFAAKVHAFNAGYVRVKGLNYEVIGSLDGDISFDEDYFSFLLRKLAEDHTLGLVGTPYKDRKNQTYDYRFASTEFVSGACQLFRRECFEQISGYVPVEGGGVDHIAVLSARMKGWKTRTFMDKVCLHHRISGTAQHGLLTARFRTGVQDYALGGHPIWEVFRTVHQLTKRPRVVGGLMLLAGYVWALVTRMQRPISPEMVAFRRRDQMRRLVNFLTGHRRLPGVTA